MLRRRAILLAVVIAAAYANAFPGAFHFDDWHVIEENPHVRSLASIPRFFVDPDTTTILHENKDLRPLLMTTFALNHAVSGRDPSSYLAVNLALHWLATLLVFRIVRDHLWLGEAALPVATAAALIVAVHPLNTEPVNYISARSALLTAVFYLGAFDAAVRRRALLAVLLLAGAMLTKAIAVTLPLMVVAWFVIARRRVPWALVASLAATAGAGILYRRLLLPPWVVAAARQAGMTPWTYLMTEWSAYLYYLRLFVWPDALVVDRIDYPIAHTFFSLQAAGSLAVLVALAVLAWRAHRHLPALGFAAVWYGIALAAESSVFPLAEPVNEHRPYLGMLGLATIAALALHAAVRVAPARRRRAAFATLVGLVCAALGLATVARNRVWVDDLALWRDATRKAPRNERAWLNAGHAAMLRGHNRLARRLLLQGHRLSPCYAYLQMNLSALEAREGNTAASLRWADEAVQCNPGLALAHYHRALAFERLDRGDEALAEYQQTVAIDPVHFAAWLAQGRLLEQHGQWAAAAAAYDGALAANPGSAEAAMLAGVLYQHRLGDGVRALERFDGVLRRDPGHYGAHYQRAVALLALGRTAEARAAWRTFLPMARAIGDQDSIDAAPTGLRDLDG
ncbi:MAG: tetratricopeptide repeat protein [Candidatus Binatia bacterium]